jgi:hypothetical protein
MVVSSTGGEGIVDEGWTNALRADNFEGVTDDERPTSEVTTGMGWGMCECVLCG